MGTGRLYYVDWLRVLVVLSLIPFHAALTYLRYGVVYIKAPVSGVSALPFLILSVPLGDFSMALLFFVSGMASFHSFRSRGSRSYVWERTKKLMFPFLLGFLFPCIETAYLKALYEGYSGGFLRFVPQFFWYQRFHYLGYAHLWFLLYLFVFSMLCTPLFGLWQRDEGRLERTGAFLSQGNRLLLPIGFVMLLEVCLRPLFHPDAYTIVFDWANDAVYLSLFVYGYVFAADRRIQEKIKGYYRPSTVFGALSLAMLYYVNIQSQVLYSNEAYLTRLWALGRGVFECSAIVFLLNAGRAYLNRGGRAIEYLTRASFTIYFLHYLPVTFFTLVFVDLNAHRLVRFLLVVGLSYIAVFVMYELWRRVLHLFARRVEASVAG